ncbi:MAG TPA: hydantoinase/oxoprolinase family protein, partial [Planctomycetes bacterium]|nr:hydantoinase/oxoprolinase family protein [Planctomycetota bacterium]
VHLKGAHRVVQVRDVKLRIGVDSGGTFTDIVIDSADGVVLRKVPSTPDDPARAILAALDSLTPDEVIHGSTVATNALLERQLARAAFVTNRGFVDLLDIGRQRRPAIYDLHPDPVPALIPGADRFEISGRLGPGGEILEEIDDEELVRLGELIGAQGFEAVAVGLLHSTEQGAHEQRVRELLAVTGIPVIISREVAAEPREWERFTTACASACLTPVMERYLQRLAAGLSPARLKLMDSAGAAVPWQRLSCRPVRTILSGPAGGVVAAAARSGSGAAIALDMGGTSTDVTLVGGDQAVARNRRSIIGGVPLSVPLLDVHTVGAGGGSLAWVDAGGALRVGPRSAGADPGPAAYGRGGVGATVTDAHLVLGRLPEDLQLGATLSLDLGAAREAVSTIARQLHMTIEQTAAGIIEVVDAEMERAIRRVSQERGVDPRGMAMVCFGGAGGLHAVSLARSCGMGQIRLPAAAGVLSAIGMLEAPWGEELEEVLLETIDSGFDERLQVMEQQLASVARGRIKEAGGDDEQARIEMTLRARHAGQSHDMEYSPGASAEEGFRELYQQRYGYRMPERDVEAVAIRVSATLAPAGELQAPAEIQGPATTTRVIVEAGAEAITVPRVHHGSISGSETLEGPALVISSTTTLWLPEGSRLRADGDGTLIIDPGTP